MKLTETEIQGMMMGNWEAGTRLDVTPTVRAVCLDGCVWELQNCDEELLCTMNPTAMGTDRELKQVISAVENGRDVSEVSGSYSPARSD